MSESRQEGIRTGAAPGAASSGDGAFGVRHRFPGEASPPPAAPPPAAPRRSKSLLTRVVLPLCLFLVVIGGIAWVTQNMPSWRKPAANVPRAGNSNEPLLRFPFEYAVWDKENPGYAAEYERGVEGHYDFPFENLRDESVEIGLHKPGCDCSRYDVAFLDRAPWEHFVKLQAATGALKLPPDALPKDLKWTPLNEPSVTVPPKQTGLLRIVWKGRKDEGQFLVLSFDVWLQPHQKASLRQIAKLAAFVIMVSPANYIDEKISLDVLGTHEKREVEFICWTSTRPALDLSIVQNPPDPLVEYRIVQLSAAEREKWQKELMGKKINTRVNAAAKVIVTVHEKKGEKQLDQGPFRLEVPLAVEGVPLGKGPLVHGYVRGIVDIGGAEDSGRVNLKTFSARSGTKRVVLLRADKGLGLEVAQRVPPYLEAKVTEQKKDGKDATGRWTLEVEVPPGRTSGPLPEDAAIILRTQAAPPRYIRIPVVGTATQG